MEPITGTGSISPESVSATNNGHQPVKQLQQSHVPPRGEEKVTANIIDNIPVFCCLWRSHVLLRRIDSDYVNVTAVCQALHATHVLAESLKLPGATIVEGNKNETVNGIWVHHTFVAGWVEQLGISDDLVKQFLDINLVNRFPLLTETVSAYRSSRQGHRSFGPPFGYRLAGPRTTTHHIAGDTMQQTHRIPATIGRTPTIVLDHSSDISESRPSPPPSDYHLSQGAARQLDDFVFAVPTGPAPRGQDVRGGQSGL